MTIKISVIRDDLDSNHSWWFRYQSFVTM